MTLPTPLPWRERANRSSQYRDQPFAITTPPAPIIAATKRIVFTYRAFVRQKRYFFSMFLEIERTGVVSSLSAREVKSLLSGDAEIVCEFEEP
jgi:hypothetical protein